MRGPQRVLVEPIAPRSAKSRASSLGCLVIALSIACIETAYLFHRPAHKTTHPRLPTEDQAYFDVLGPPIDKSGSSMDALLDLYDAAQKNVPAIQTPAWQAKAKAACAALDAEGEQLINVAPVPEDCLPMRNDAVLVGRQMRLIASAFLKGANPHQPDLNLLTQAIENVDDVTKRSQTLADDSNKIRVKYGVESTQPDRVKAGK